MPKIYLSSGYQNKFGMILLKEKLMKELNYEILCSWLDRYCSISYEHDVGKDFQEMEEADIIISVYPWGSGTLSEISFCLGLGKKVIVCIPEEFLPEFDANDEKKYSEFFPLVKVKEKGCVVGTIYELLEILKYDT
jgi:hypothetical protein